MMLRPSLAFLLSAGMLLLTQTASAHKVNLFAYVSGDEVYLEGYFNKGRPAQNSKVVVFDAKGDEVLHGLTDKKGRYSFKKPGTDALKVTLYAGEGHKAEYFLGANKKRTKKTESTPATSDAIIANSEVAKQVAVDDEGLNLIVSKAVGEAIRPLMRSLSELKEQRSFSDIIGGIGFIFGLLGVFFYLQARKMSKKPN